MKCPSCRKKVEKKLSGIWPFCSERCKMRDLGKWMNEEYRIPDNTRLPDHSRDEELEIELDNEKLH